MSKILKAFKESGIDFEFFDSCVTEAVRVCQSNEVQELMALAYQPAARQMPNSPIPVRKKGKGKVQKYRQ